MGTELSRLCTKKRHAYPLTIRENVGMLNTAEPAIAVRLDSNKREVGWEKNIGEVLSAENVVLYFERCHELSETPNPLFSGSCWYRKGSEKGAQSHFLHSRRYLTFLLTLFCDDTKLVILRWHQVGNFTFVYPLHLLIPYLSKLRGSFEMKPHHEDLRNF